MHIGVGIRNMGPQSTPEIMAACAQAAEGAGLDSIWITDHIAIPPDDAEGSGGRYMDTLTTLAWLAAATDGIGLGSAVLILPYRAALATAKQVATVQELSGERLMLGVGVGWMAPEFQAVGVDRRRRGAITDETLAFMNACFAADEVEANGQPLLFRPRPAKPPFLIGGKAPYALARAVAHGEGWLPVVRGPEEIADDVARYRALTAAAGKPDGSVTVSTRLPLDDAVACRDLLAQYRDLGVERLICGFLYDDGAGFQERLARLVAVSG